MPRNGSPARHAKLQRLLQRGTEDHYRDPVLYDLEYRDRDEDVEWYRAFVAEQGQSKTVLELGAGSGRVACPLAEAGHHVIALDRMQAMLDALTGKLAAADDDTRDRVTVVCGDMLALPLDDASCDVVIAPFNALMHLYQWEDLLACLREAHRVLVPGGRLAFDVQLPDLEWLTWDPQERHAVTYFRDPHTDERMVYSTNHTYDASTQICHIRIYYDVAPRQGRRFQPPPKPRKLVHLAHRQIFPEELRMLVAQAGLLLEHHGGDFDGSPLRTGVESQLVVARKPLRRGRLRP